MQHLPPPSDSAALINIELEQAILGTLLGDSALVLWPQVVTAIKPEHFSEPLHSRIYEAVAKQAVAGVPPSLMTLKTMMAQDATLNEVGGAGYLARLISCAVTAMQLRHDAETLCDLAARRAAVTAADAMAEAAQTIKPGEQFRPIIAKHIEDMQTLFDQGSTRKTTFSAGDAASSLMDRINRVRQGEVDPNAIKTGIASIDRQTGGLHRGEFIVLGARPSVGKSALATQIAFNVAKRGQGVAYFSLEMTEEQLISRIVSSVLWSPQGSTNVSYERIRHANLNDVEMRWASGVAEELAHYPLIIDTKEGLVPAELEARANVIKSRLARDGRSLDLVVIDHMHRMQQPGTRSDVEKYSEISARLAEMAKRLNCPLLTLAQLNRGLEGREDKRPQLSDLRASGSIEQDADVALFVHRPAYHLSRTKHLDPMKDMDRLADLAAVENVFEVIVEKQRNGPTGTIELWCDMAHNVICERSEAAALSLEAAE